MADKEGKEVVGYFCDTRDLNIIEGVMTTLFRSNDRPEFRTADTRRDLANTLFAVLQRIKDVPLHEGDHL